MANIAALVDELTNDPLTRGYAGMTDQQVADSLNTKDRSRNLPEITGDAAFQATDSTEWAGLSDLNKQLWVGFCGRNSIDPFGSANVALVQNLFGGGSTTVANLQSLRTETISRGQELGFGADVPVGHVEMARAMMA